MKLFETSIICHINPNATLQGHYWNFTYAAQMQIQRGYVYESNGINQPACNEIANHLEALNAGRTSMNLATKHIPLDIRRFLIGYYQVGQYDRYMNAMSMKDYSLNLHKLAIGRFTVVGLREVEN
jgi:hypothetical protein